jgi:hypothetical protein
MSTKKQSAETKSFNIGQLQIISHSCSILKSCDGIQPFSLANKINKCGLAAEASIEAFKNDLGLIREREKEATNQDTIKKDIEEILNKPYPINSSEFKEDEFASLEISGDKEIAQADGNTKKFSYRDAYFSLVNIGLIL